MNPQVIIIEGCDYTGKTTVAKHLFDELDKLYPGKVVMYRNPGGTELGEKIRDIARCEAKSLMTQAFAYLTALSSVYESAREDVKNGKIVILDRWYWSTLAYQILPMRLNKDTTIIKMKFMNLVKQLFHFDNFLLFYFTVPFETMMERMKLNCDQRQDSKDRFDLSDDEYKKEIWNNYGYILEDLLDGIFFRNTVAGNSTYKIFPIDTTDQLENVKINVLNYTIIKSLIS